MPAIRAVVFDVGETLVDETSIWSDWADWLGVPRFTFLAALGGVIARGLDHREAFGLIRPGLDPDAERRARTAAGRRHHVTADDLYPDAVSCLHALVTDGFRVGIAANQPRAVEPVLHSLGVPLALVASSERWGVAKPEPAFFSRICDELEMPAPEIAYVGDRLDNDIGPAAAAGMVAVFVRRGPWAILQSATVDPRSVGAAASIESLDELPGVLRAMVADR
ncbi:MAG TPA: HAD family hydrolase [Candidatus Limnocylindrales bacterium]|nr:HAD family hydrolase [Candidatus Limnocylindrales bacterium]